METWHPPVRPFSDRVDWLDFSV